jgi:hypothetical protein
MVYIHNKSIQYTINMYTIYNKYVYNIDIVEYNILHIFYTIYCIKGGRVRKKNETHLPDGSPWVVLMRPFHSIFLSYFCNNNLAEDSKFLSQEL